MQRRCIIHSSLFIKHMLLFTPFIKRTLLPVNRVTSMSSRACLKKHAFDTIIMEDTKMIKAGIIGATGYAGNEIVRLLLGHKNVEVAWYGSRSYIDKKYAGIYQNFFKLVDAKCMDDNMEALADVLTTSSPSS